MANDYLQNVLGQDYQEQDITQSSYVKITNGKFQFIIIDIDKPDKVFFDLTKVFNASTGEGQKILPIQFVRGGKVITDMTGYSISMAGTYPDNATPFHVQGELMNSTTGAFINFPLPLGLFQAVGVYSFQFTITNTSTGDKETSHYMFFNVTQSSVSLAESWNSDITPFDNQYQKWLSGVENQINTLTTTLNDIKSMAQTYANNIQASGQNAGEEAAKGLLGDENQWTATQHFSNTTANDMQSGTAEITTLNVSGKANLPKDQVSFGNFMGSQITWMDTTQYTPTLQNGTASANGSRQYWLWVHKMVPGNVDTPYYILHADLLIDCDDVGKAIATFANWDAGSSNPGTCQSVLGGQIQFHIDSSGNMILESVKGVSGNVWARFTAMM